MTTPWRSSGNSSRSAAPTGYRISCCFWSILRSSRLASAARSHVPTSSRPTSGSPSSAIAVHETGRGGDVTYHGPGQIVGYPILDLRPDRCDVHRYVRDLEEVMIRTCADYGVTARPHHRTDRHVGRRGEDRRDRRFASRAGSRATASRSTSSTNLDHFKLIVPCGIPDRGVTSLEKATGRSVPMREVEDALVRHFAEVFERLRRGAPQRPTSRAAAGRRRPDHRSARPRPRRVRRSRRPRSGRCCHVTTSPTERRPAEQQQHEAADRRHLRVLERRGRAPRRPHRAARCRARGPVRPPRARSAAAARPSSISPTTSSKRSSIVTRPAVPPC